MSELGATRAYRLRWWTLITIAVSILVIVLDATVMNVALPTIQRELDASSAQLLWMVSIYTMMFGALMLTTGSLADRLGRAKLLQSGVAVFGLASIGAYFSGTAVHLIIWRVFQGIGGAMIMPATLAIITNIFPEDERPRAIGIWAGLNAIGIALGPIIGGALVQNFNWNSIFLINIPIAAIALIMGLFLVPDSKDSHPRKLDPVGNILSLAGLGSFIYGLINGGTRGWTDAQVIATLIAGGLILLLFVLWEAHRPDPLMELRFFKNHRFTAGIIVLVILGLALNGFQYISTFYMQFVKAYTALGTGVRYVPLAVGLMLGAVGSARLSKSIGSKWVMLIGFVGVAGILFAMSAFTIGTSYSGLGGAFFFLGAFLGLITAPVTDVIMGSLPKDQAGMGSAMNTVLRMVSGTVGVAILGSVLSSVYTSHFDKAAAAIPGLPAAIVQTASNSVGAAVLIASSGQIPAALANPLALAAKQSFMDGWHILAIVTGFIGLVGAVVVITFMPNRAGQPAKGSAVQETTGTAGRQ
jgi:EmrB/QacA subfamily drug resistance transporter